MLWRNIDVVGIEDAPGSAVEELPMGTLGGGYLLRHPGGNHCEVGFAARRFRCEEGVVVGFLEVCFPIGIAFDDGSYECSSTCIGGFHIGYEIAERIYEQYIFPLFLIAHHLHRLDHVGMTADYQIHALIHKEIGDVLLVFILQQYVFYAPMYRDHHYLRPGFAGFTDLMRHSVAFNQRHFYAIVWLNTVGAVGIIKESNFESVDILYERHELFALCSIVECADMVYSERVKGGEGASCRAITPVKAVIVGCEEEIETCILEGLGV